MSLVVDASVAIKWFVIESSRDYALAIIDFKTELVAPELFKAEFTNVLWKKVRRSEVSLEHAKLLIERVESFVTFVPTSFEVGQSALQFAVMLDHPSYDCVYLAWAERLGTKLVTADRKFADKLDKVGLGHLVMRLGDAKPTDLTKPIISDEDLKNVIALSARYNETIASVYRQLKSSSKRFHPLPRRNCSQLGSPLFVGDWTPPSAVSLRLNSRILSPWVGSDAAMTV